MESILDKVPKVGRGSCDPGCSSVGGGGLRGVGEGGVNFEQGAKGGERSM